MVPCPGRERIWRAPPSAASRSAIPCRPAPRRQRAGREEQEHERDREDDGREAALGERAYLLRGRERPGEGRDPDDRVDGSDREKPLRRTSAQHDPADEVAGPADDEGAERGVGRDRHREGQLGGQVAVGQVIPGHQGQGCLGDRGQDRRGPQRGDDPRCGGFHPLHRRDVPSGSMPVMLVTLGGGARVAEACAPQHWVR
jgi:hypothetical protein